MTKMRTLRFIVDGQIIKQDSTCDFDGLVPGTANHLVAEFSFSKEWDGYAKVATFWSPLGREYEPALLTPDGSCVIPYEALKKKSFKIQIVGKNDTSKLTTNKVEVIQNGGKK